MKPMLAHRFHDHEKKVVYPVFTQPKLNGVRALYHRGNFQSRHEEPWRESVLAHITTELANSPVPDTWLLDGELYVHGWSLQKINSAIAVKRLEPKPETLQVEYHVFDVIDIENHLEDFSYRAEKLELLQMWFDKIIKPVQTSVAHSRKELDTQHRQNCAAGYEGTIIRLNRHYGFTELCGNQENRWHYLLKYKDWLDQEYEVLGFEYGEGKYANLIGALQLSHNGQPFTAGSGLTDAQRDPNNPPKWVRVKYEMLSDGGVPLKPTIDFVSYE